MSVSIIAGLGNPGERYQGTRHNIGFDAIDALLEEAGGSWERNKRFKLLFAKIAYREHSLHLIKPQTFMNLSGQCLQKVCSFYKSPPEQLLVIHDDIHLKVGQSKLSLRGGSGGHNGVNDIIGQLGESFLRYRIGVGEKKHPDIPLSDHVLKRFEPKEQALMESAINQALANIKLLIDKGPIDAMNFINKKTESKKNEHNIEQV